MPRINIQVVGLIELDLPAGTADSCAEGASGLWQDLVQIGVEPTQAAVEAYGAGAAPTPAPRWERDAGSAAGLAAPPAIQADLSSLRRQLDAELDTLVERICAARREVS